MIEVGFVDGPDSVLETGLAGDEHLSCRIRLWIVVEFNEEIDAVYTGEEVITQDKGYRLSGGFETFQRCVSVFDILGGLDPELALAAEAAAIAATVDDDPGGDDETGKGSERRTPWAEATRLGQPLIVTPGQYTLRVTLGDATHETEFTVDAPSEWTPRIPKKPRIRGQKDEGARP